MNHNNRIVPAFAGIALLLIFFVSKMTCRHSSIFDRHLSLDRSICAEEVHQYNFDAILNGLERLEDNLRPLFEREEIPFNERLCLVDDYVQIHTRRDDKKYSAPLSILCISAIQSSWKHNSKEPCVILYIGDDNGRNGCKKLFGDRIPFQNGSTWMLPVFDYVDFCNRTESSHFLKYPIRLFGSFWLLASDSQIVDGAPFSSTIGTTEFRVAFNKEDSAFNKNAAANELFSLPELPDGVVGDLARMFASPDEDEVWRDYCLQFLGSALEREDGVTDEDRALARETLVEALASTNATFAGTALRALHRGDPADPLVASNAIRIARDPSYPSASRTTALLILEDCVRATASTASTASTTSTLAETASAVSADPSASSLLRQTAEAVLKRIAD